MKTLEFGIGASLAKILESLRGVKESEVTIIIPREAPILQNPLNRKILEEISESFGKKLQFAEGVILKEENLEKESKSEPADGQSTSSQSSDYHTLLRAKSSLSKVWWKSSLFLVGALIVVLLLSFLGGGFLFLNMVPSAKITLYLDSQPLEKEVSLSGSTLASTLDTESGTIPLETLTKTLSSTSSAKATGKKTVGNPSRGTVTIRNYNTVTDKSFPKGTILKGNAPFEQSSYTLDQAVTVSKGTTSSRIDNTGKKINETDPGRKDVEVSASELGEKHNTPGGQTFVVGPEGFENVNAVANAGLTGGTSKEINAVSESDVKNLLDKLTKELEIKAKEEFLSKLAEGQKLVEGSTQTKLNSKQLSKQIGEEADNFGLTAEVTVTALVYNQKDLRVAILKSVGSGIPEGYELTEGSEIGADIIRVKDKEVSMLAHIKGTLLTKVDKETLINNLKGKGVSSAQNYLRSQPNIAGFEIVLVPTLPGPLNKIPANSNKIRLEMVKKSG